MTTLELTGPEIDVQIKLVSKLGKRERRTMARSFLQQIRPWTKCFTRTELHHSVNRRPPVERKISGSIVPFESKTLHARAGAVGFEIRMSRLKLGQSQAQLAEQLGIRRSHLSEIERGIHLPHRKTRIKLERLLEIRLPDFDEAGRDVPLELSDVGSKPDTPPQ